MIRQASNKFEIYDLIWQINLDFFAFFSLASRAENAVQSVGEHLPKIRLRQSQYGHCKALAGKKQLQNARPFSVNWLKFDDLLSSHESEHGHCDIDICVRHQKGE